MNVDREITDALAQPGAFYVAAAGSTRPFYVVHRGVFTHAWPPDWMVAGRETLGLTLVELPAGPPPVETFGGLPTTVPLSVHRHRLTLRGPVWACSLPDIPARIRELAPPWLRDEPLRFMFGWESWGWDVRLVVAAAELPPGQLRPSTFEFSGEWWVDFATRQRDVLPYQGNGKGSPR